MTPIRQYMSPLETSPANSYREHLRRRTSSFSSNHDRSPVSSRKNRFSNASQYSNDFSPLADAGGAGNLADELDDLDDDLDADEEGGGETLLNGEAEGETQPSLVDGARDSGIDVSYGSKKHSPRMMKNFSKPFATREKPPDEEEEEEGEGEDGDGEDQIKLSPELEDAINTIARMTSYTSTSDDPLIPRTIALLQHLTNQSQLEASAQRLTTSTNSLTSHLLAQSKAIQALAAATFYSPFAFSTSLDLGLVEETTPFVEALLTSLPLPDPAPTQGMQKLDRETTNVIHTLSQLTDTLQMGKQTINAASRHLRTTQTMVAELRRERERAETARLELSHSVWEGRIRERWCAEECKDILSGFESVCDSLRASMEHAWAPAGAAA